MPALPPGTTDAITAASAASLPTDSILFTCAFCAAAIPSALAFGAANPLKNLVRLESADVNPKNFIRLAMPRTNTATRLFIATCTPSAKSFKASPTLKPNRSRIMPASAVTSVPNASQMALATAARAVNIGAMVVNMSPTISTMGIRVAAAMKKISVIASIAG